MDQSIELLNYIHENASMGMEAVDTLLKTGLDSQTTEHLQKQHGDYDSIRRTAAEQLQQWNHQGKEPGAMEKVMSYLVINAKTLVDSSPSHIAEMMMQGSVMGIIDITKRLKKCAGAEQAQLDLGNSLLKLEEDSLQQWRTYLDITA